jgi:hypothetical protein
MPWKQRRLSLLTPLLAVSVVACVGSSENSDSASPTAGSPTSPSPSSEAKVEGAIAGPGGACPNLSFAINGQGVLTNSSTRFEHSACSDLRTGMQVEVEGARQANGMILARKVERKDVEQQPQEVELEGPIAGLSGTCPTLSFAINGQGVLTNSSTRFEHAACSDLRTGMQVEVEGARQANGAILARKVERKDVEQQEVEFKGPVAGLAGTCPNLSFSINGQRVVTGAGTRFDKLSCSDVRNAMQVEVKGVRQSDASVMATRVKRED